MSFDSCNLKVMKMVASWVHINRGVEIKAPYPRLSKALFSLVSKILILFCSVHMAVSNSLIHLVLISISLAVTNSSIPRWISGNHMNMKAYLPKKKKP